MKFETKENKLFRFKKGAEKKGVESKKFQTETILSEVFFVQRKQTINEHY